MRSSEKKYILNRLNIIKTNKEVDIKDKVRKMYMNEVEKYVDSKKLLGKPETLEKTIKQKIKNHYLLTNFQYSRDVETAEILLTMGKLISVKGLKKLKDKYSDIYNKKIKSLYNKYTEIETKIMLDNSEDALKIIEEFEKEDF